MAGLLRRLDTSPRSVARRGVIAFILAAGMEYAIVAIAEAAEWPASAFYSASALLLAIFIVIALPVVQPPEARSDESGAKAQVDATASAGETVRGFEDRDEAQRQREARDEALARENDVRRQALEQQHPAEPWELTTQRELEALSRRLAHPLRVRIILILAADPQNPRDLAAQLQAPLGTVSYHLRVLLDVGVVERGERRSVRGRDEWAYRLTPRGELARSILAIGAKVRLDLTPQQKEDLTDQQERESDLVLRSLKHPLRARMILALAIAAAPLRPSDLGELLGAPSGNVSYHLRILRGLDIVEFAERREVAGKVEYFYRLTDRGQLVRSILAVPAELKLDLAEIAEDVQA